MLEHGLPCGVVTGGGTGTFLDDAATGVFTELQPGSYVFSDADYARNLGPGGEEVRAADAGGRERWGRGRRRLAGSSF